MKLSLLFQMVKPPNFSGLFIASMGAINVVNWSSSNSTFLNPRTRSRAKFGSSLLVGLYFYCKCSLKTGTTERNAFLSVTALIRPSLVGVAFSVTTSVAVHSKMF